MNAVTKTDADQAQPTAIVPVRERAIEALAVNALPRAELEALAAKHTGITAITNAAGRDDCHSAYMEIKNTRVAIEKAGKDARDDAQKFAKAVIEQERELVAIISSEEERLKKLRDEWDAARERERLEEAQREEHRVANHMRFIETIKNMPSTAVGKTSAELQASIEGLDAMPLDSLEEFCDQAKATRVNVRAQLVAMLAGTVKAEQDAAELERLRKAEAERQVKEAAERAAREKAEADAAARARAEEESRLAAMRKAEEERIARERAEHEQRMAAEARAAAEKIANERAEQERRDAEARAVREAEERRLAQERADLERQQREAAAAEQRRQEELARVDAKIAAGATKFYAALVRLEAMLPPGTPEGDVVHETLRDAGF